jgi:hypothetical protein
MTRRFDFESESLMSHPIQGESENLEANTKETLFYAYAPSIIADVDSKYPGSPTTKSVTCFLRKLMKVTQSIKAGGGR